MNIKDIVGQLEKPNYQTKDGLHNLKDNAAFVSLKDIADNSIDMIQELKQIVNSYTVINGDYVIKKTILDAFIEELESK